VRIGLERLDRMMNAVGELVINRTRMLGRVAELERLADVLNFSKARMQDKVLNFRRSTSSAAYTLRQLRGRQTIFRFGSGYSAIRTALTIHWPSSANWKWIAMMISISSRAR